MTVLASQVAGIDRPCPRCDAQPGEPCRDKTGRTRSTTHQERKPKEWKGNRAAD
jgi:hypothetical protein